MTNHIIASRPKRRLSIEQHRAAIRYDSAPVPPSCYCQQLAKSDADGLVFWLRVSSKSQRLHLPPQREDIEAAAAALGKRVVARREYVGPGHVAHPALAALARLAKRKGLAVVAVDATRFLRADPQRFSRDDVRRKRNIPASAREWDELKALIGDVPLLTLQPPDEPERPSQTKRGMRTPETRGGRPRKKKTQRLIDLAKAVEMFDAGYSLKDIADAVSRTKSTVQYWHEMIRTKIWQIPSNRDARKPLSL